MEWEVAISILLVGITIVVAILINFGFQLLSLPAITGYFILGIVLKAVSEEFSLYSDFSQEIFYFLSNLGIIALLFRIGLESKLGNLIELLPKALVIWMGDVFVSGLLGFVTSYWLLGLDLIPSLFIAVAFTPTSVGISVAVWEELKAIGSTEGQVMLDTAELDDLSGILLMGILFAIAPMLQQQPETTQITGIVLETTVIFLFKMILLGAVCLIIARFIQEPLTTFLNKIHSGDSEMLVVLGIGLIVAASASLVGLSVAVGAFFAGLIFSSNPDAVKIDASFEAIYALFVPFFFVGIGLMLELSVLTVAIGPAIILLIAAAVGKLLGAGIPAMATLGKGAGVLIGLSMIPRAEIALIIIQRGFSLGEWAVSSTIFAYIVVICFVTTLLIPLMLRTAMKYHQPNLQQV